MKRLSDYKDDEAIDLWADLLDSITAIAMDPEVKEVVGQPPLVIAKKIIKLHKTETVQILTRIDPTPINGLNIVVRLIDVLMEIEESPEIMGFLDGSAASEQSKPSGSVTENTEAKGK